MKPLLIAHRGDTRNFPENTLAAFASAFEKGADGVELDVHLQMDKIIVVHDYPFHPGKNQLLLTTVLEQFANKGRIEIEIKSFELNCLKRLKQVLARYPQADIELTTSIFPLALYIHDAFPRLPLGIIFRERDFEPWMTAEFKIAKVVAYMQLMHGTVTHVIWSQTTKAMVEACHQQKLKFHTHILKQDNQMEKEIYQKLTSWQVEQCTIDDIALLKNLRG